MTFPRWWITHRQLFMSDHIMDAGKYNPSFSHFDKYLQSYRFKYNEPVMPRDRKFPQPLCIHENT